MQNRGFCFGELKMSDKRIRPKQPITHEDAISALTYDPLTGLLKWKTTRGGRLTTSSIGALRPDGYLSIGFKDNKLLVHRLIWFIVYGTWPNEVDHINGNRTDNRLVNLREVVRAENRQNLDRNNPHNKSTGLVGSSFSKRNGTYRAYININRKQIHLGHFKTADLAHAAYLSAKSVIHTHHDRMIGDNS
jgi:hypothetical protein